MRGIGCNVSPAVELDLEVHQHLALHGTGEPHREQYKIGLELEPGPRHAPEIGAPVGEHAAFQSSSVELLHSSVLTGKRSGGDAPLSIATFLMRMGRTKLHRPKRPGRCPRAISWGLRQQLELSDAARSLTNARPRAIGSSVTSTDDDNAPPPSVVIVFGYRVPGTGYRASGIGHRAFLEPPVLRRQEIHREIDPRELAPGNVKIPRLTSARSDANRIELGSYLANCNVLPNSDAGAESNSLRLELIKSEIEHRLLELELGYPVPKQSPNALTLLEYHDIVPKAPQLLRGSEASGPGPNHGDSVSTSAPRRPRHNPAFREPTIRDRLLDVPDGNGVVDQTEHASRLARRRTQPSCQLRKIVRGME